ncbi:hypothetical protein QBC37DRAFT_421226 [Rhypophila decipiens]|uniref:GPI anchored protein n=1 Tax=Rhypophila decipiens TaxID=261697 RepID=A0AAN7B6E6_9PEZI|nr:hypothetical protein QBC37DRAFT_421226 [Rhypophila decipiens]
MINNILPLILLPLLTFHPLLAEAQQSGSTIAVGPPLTCSLITFTCPSITNGCCEIAGCCGTGCCALGYTCINEGTADQACCPNTDPTKCGTVSSPPPDTGGTGGSSGEPKTCTQIHNCRDSSTGQTWTCLLGQTCTLYYRGCNPCPYIDNIGTGGGDGSSDSPSPTTTTTSFDSTDTSTATDTATGAPAAATTTKASGGSLSGHGGSSWVNVMPLIVMGIPVFYLVA